MKYQQQAVPSNTHGDYAGFSLRYAQTCFGAPVKHHFAWEAWEATEFKHTTEEAFPDAFVPVWFWSSAQGIMPLGHVLIWDPEKKKLFGPPPHGHGDFYYDLENVVGDFCKYVGWSEDINGLRVVTPVD